MGLKVIGDVDDLIGKLWYGIIPSDGIVHSYLFCSVFVQWYTFGRTTTYSLSFYLLLMEVFLGSGKSSTTI